MSMMALTAATGVFAIVPPRHHSTFLSNISIPVQATTSISLAVDFKSDSCASRSAESVWGKVEDLFPEMPGVGERNIELHGVGVGVRLISLLCPLRPVLLLVSGGRLSRRR